MGHTVPNVMVMSNSTRLMEKTILGKTDLAKKLFWKTEFGGKSISENKFWEMAMDYGPWSMDHGP